MRATDFVHLHGVWETNLLRASMLCRRFSVPYCVCCCGMLDVWSMQQSAWKKKLAMRLGFRRMLDGAAFIHALNADEIELMRPLGLKAPPVIIPNGIFLNEVEGRGRCGRLARTALCAVSVAASLQEGSRHSCRCLSPGCTLFPDVDLVVAGPDGGAEDEFRERIRQYGLQERVHMTGGLYGPAKIAALKRAACFCLPSRQEGSASPLPRRLPAACRWRLPMPAIFRRWARRGRYCFPA